MDTLSLVSSPLHFLPVFSLLITHRHSEFAHPTTSKGEILSTSLVDLDLLETSRFNTTIDHVHFPALPLSCVHRPIAERCTICEQHQQFTIHQGWCIPVTLLRIQRHNHYDPPPDIFEYRRSVASWAHFLQEVSIEQLTFVTTLHCLNQFWEMVEITCDHQVCMITSPLFEHCFHPLTAHFSRFRPYLLTAIKPRRHHRFRHHHQLPGGTLIYNTSHSFRCWGPYSPLSPECYDLVPRRLDPIIGVFPSHLYEKNQVSSTVNTNNTVTITSDFRPIQLLHGPLNLRHEPINITVSTNPQSMHVETNHRFDPLSIRLDPIKIAHEPVIIRSDAVVRHQFDDIHLVHDPIVVKLEAAKSEHHVVLKTDHVFDPIKLDIKIDHHRQTDNETNNESGPLHWFTKNIMSPFMLFVFGPTYDLLTGKSVGGVFAKALTGLVDDILEVLEAIVQVAATLLLRLVIRYPLLILVLCWYLVCLLRYRSHSVAIVSIAIVGFSAVYFFAERTPLPADKGL